MEKRNRDRKPARRAPYKDSRPVILIVCEGEVTEPEYFFGLARICKNSRVRVEYVSGAGVPQTIVETAKVRKREAKKRATRENDENLNYDQIWCVFDVDDHPNVANAKQAAIDDGIELAVSHPCFELWLWLHLFDSPGIQHRHDLQKKLKVQGVYFDKHVNFEYFAHGIDDAERRAFRLDSEAAADGEPGRNPTTGVWRLAKAIREISIDD